MARAHYPAVAEVLGDWLASGDGQDVIARWGITGSAGSLFVPALASAVVWPPGKWPRSRGPPNARVVRRHYRPKKGQRSVELQVMTAVLD